MEDGRFRGGGGSNVSMDDGRSGEGGGRIAAGKGNFSMDGGRSGEGGLTTGTGNFWMVDRRTAGGGGGGSGLISLELLPIESKDTFF